MYDENMNFTFTDGQVGAVDDPKLMSKAEKGEVSSPDVSGLEDSDQETDTRQKQTSPPVTSTPYAAPKRDDERMSVASSVR